MVDNSVVALPLSQHTFQYMHYTFQLAVHTLHITTEVTHAAIVQWEYLTYDQIELNHMGSERHKCRKNTNMHEYNLLHNTVCLLIRSSQLIFVINNTFALLLPNTHFDACTIHCSWQSPIPTDVDIQCHCKPSFELSPSSKGGTYVYKVHARTQTQPFYISLLPANY